mgnify:CR=1 FL=1|jgi:Tfp pilus assembly protein PilN
MPSINMIAARGAERKRLEKFICITLLVILCEVAATLFIFGFMTTRIYTANCQLRDLDKRLTKIKPTVDKIRSYEAELTKLQPKLDLLASSREQTLVWYSLLQNLAYSMPEKTWLSAVSTSRVQTSTTSADNQQSPPTTVSLRGISTSQALIGDTMLRLSQLPVFERVDLDYTQNSPGRAVDCLEFQLTAKMKQQSTPKGGS